MENAQNDDNLCL